MVRLLVCKRMVICSALQRLEQRFIESVLMKIFTLQFLEVVPIDAAGGEVGVAASVRAGG
jgi:hypothetical protein